MLNSNEKKFAQIVTKITQTYSFAIEIFIFFQGTGNDVSVERTKTTMHILEFQK